MPAIANHAAALRAKTDDRPALIGILGLGCVGPLLALAFAEGRFRLLGLDAAATKPFGFMRFNPGHGWAGRCIAVDPFRVAWRARESGATTRFVELAGEVRECACRRAWPRSSWSPRTRAAQG